MTPTEPPGHLCREVLAFYGEDEGPNSSGYTLEQILDWPDEDWELQHDFIQWLFATDEPSMFNSDSPVFDSDTVARFRSDPLMQHRLRRAFERWLAFCGVVRTDAGLVFGKPNPDVWNHPNHNWLRITRVLRSLNLLGLHEEARAFFALLTTIRVEIAPTTWQYWVTAARLDL